MKFEGCKRQNRIFWKLSISFLLFYAILLSGFQFLNGTLFSCTSCLIVAYYFFSSVFDIATSYNVYMLLQRDEKLFLWLYPFFSFHNFIEKFILFINIFNSPFRFFPSSFKVTMPITNFSFYRNKLFLLLMSRFLKSRNSISTV